MIIDAHMHIWNRLHGKIQNKIPLTAVGGGVVKIGKNKVQGMPAYMHDCKALAEYVIAEFNAAGVDMGIVVQENMDGEQNDYGLLTMTQHPGRFFVHGLPDFFKTDTVAKQADKLFDKGFMGLKFPAGHFGEKVLLDDKRLFPVYDRMEAEALVLAIDFSAGQAQVPAFEKVMQNFPKLPVAIGHFGMPNRDGWPGQLALCRHENVYVETGGIIWLYRHEAYPFPTGLKKLREAIKKVGADKIMWGSDWPRTMVDFTYRQSLDFFRDAKGFTDSEKQKILGENACRLYGVKPRKTKRTPVPLITA
jgi:predicted TIM-barrel fold metal-dependent hydrolase